MPLFLQGVDSNSKIIGFSCRIRGSDKVPFILRVPVPNDVLGFRRGKRVEEEVQSLKVESSLLDGRNSWLGHGETLSGCKPPLSLPKYEMTSLEYLTKETINELLLTIRQIIAGLYDGMERVDTSVSLVDMNKKVKITGYWVEDLIRIDIKVCLKPNGQQGSFWI